MLLLIVCDEKSRKDANNDQWEGEQETWLRYALGLVIVQDVIALTYLCLQETSISSCIHLIAKLAEEASQDASAIPWLIFIRAFVNTFVIVHVKTVLTTQTLIFKTLALVTRILAVNASASFSHLPLVSAALGDAGAILGLQYQSLFTTSTFVYSIHTIFATASTSSTLFICRIGQHSDVLWT